MKDWAERVAGSGVGRTLGQIVETEAYLCAGDDASHSSSGETLRNRSMFLAPGHAYVYLIYGIHHCFNVVTGPPGTGEAVLIRALEPLVGMGTMRARRGIRTSDRDLCRGPGRLCQALDIDRRDDGSYLRTGRLRLLPPLPGPGPTLDVSRRIGITKSVDLPLRFRLASSPWVSR